ncbi:MAG: hypothetical protein ACK5JT_01920 [Hyphomicrobiaceae bacterium]
MSTNLSSADERLIELAEDRLRVAEELQLSVTGLIARIYVCLECNEFDEACEHLEAMDKLINEARAARQEKK